MSSDDLHPVVPAHSSQNPRCFLSYNSLDYEWVELAKKVLAERGVDSFVDREDLPKGIPWPRALEETIGNVEAVAVFVGPHGFGRWQMREMWLALDLQSQRADSLPVVPVMLPNAERPSIFLLLNTWVLIREKSTDDPGWKQLADAVRLEAASDSRRTGQEVCPYRGLGSFREIDAPFFFGRENLSKRIVEKISSTGLVAVVGPSGSGKSSLVAAGVLPIVRRQATPQPSWDIVAFTPGERPFHRLAASLVNLSTTASSDTERLIESKKLGDALSTGQLLIEDYVDRLLVLGGKSDRMLLVADQFEELFTMSRGERSTQPTHSSVPGKHASDMQLHFAQSILGASRSKHITVLLTLRSDFYSHAITLSREFSDAVEFGLVNIGDMTPSELGQTITEPARLVGLTFEGDLAQQIQNDVGTTRGNLPLLEFALSALWERRESARLTQAAYKSIGRVDGAIANRAAAVYRELSDTEKRQTREIFTRLVRPGSSDEGTEDSRQRANVADFSLESQAVIRRLADARLVVTGRDDASGTETVEVIHEALIRRWQEVKTWLDEDREFLLWRQRLRAEVVQYQVTQRDKGALLRGEVLAEATAWQTRYGERLSQSEQELVRASSKAERRRGHLLKAGMGLIVLVALLTAWWLNQQLAQEKRLSDLQRLHLLQSSAEQLWPANSAHITDLEVWLRSAQELTQTLTQYQRELSQSEPEVQKVAKLKKEQDDIKASLATSGAGGAAGGDSALQKRLTEVTETLLPSQRKLEVLNALVSELGQLNDPNPALGLITNVKNRLEFARNVRRQSIESQGEAWQNAIRSIRDPLECPLYKGLLIKPQEGLAPLGRNPESGLWEFWHIQTGDRPVLDSNRHPILQESSGLVFVLLPPGKFTMGAKRSTDKHLGPNEDPWAAKDEVDERAEPLTVTIEKPFFLSKYEMTQGQFLRTALTNPSYYAPPGDGTHSVSYLNPVEQVTWVEANQLMGQLGLQLPTEAQWEYGARGGTTSVWWTGDTVGSLRGAANLADSKYHGGGQPGDYDRWLNDGFEIHAPVGRFRPNAFGLYDVVGNVWEWCKDTYAPYRATIASNLTDLPTGEKVIRGGGWISSAAFSRSATRDHYKPQYRYFALGLRPARALDEK
jgi:formylglycine-generating enzyme required for sulfatase activity/energy-coupling factor transporter ATP-binding protein EcfA2